MEDPQYTAKEIFWICFYEFLGTAMLTLGYNFTSAGLAVGMNLFVGIILAGKVSGGMFNPAVTVAVYTAEAKFLKEYKIVLWIILSQIIGGYFGIGYAHLIIGVPEYLCPFDQKTGCLVTG
jgi:glycerol uptake facilitator-like aquaporin